MDSLEINVEPTKGSDELGLEGIATQRDCDDVDLSPARENVKFFSQDSVSNFISNLNCSVSICCSKVVISRAPCYANVSQLSNRSISTEKSAHEVDRSKHFQRLGSAAFVGMEGLSSPNPK